MDQPHSNPPSAPANPQLGGPSPHPTEVYGAPESEDRAVRIVEILEQYLEALKAGRRPAARS